MAVHRETLWLAPTRPAMKWGVPMEAFYINMLGSFFFGLLMGAPYYWLVGVLLHYAVLRPLATWDPSCFRVLRMWLSTKGEGIGADLYGAPILVPLPAARAVSAEEYQTCV